MATWRFSGVDRTTGSDASVDVVSADRAAAEDEASRVLLIERVDELAPPPIPYASPSTPPPSALAEPPRPSKPRRSPLTDERGLFPGERRAARAFGLLALAGYAAALLVALKMSRGPSGTGRRFDAEYAAGATADAADVLVDESRRPSVVGLCALGAVWHLCRISIHNRGAARWRSGNRC